MPSYDDSDFLDLLEEERWQPAVAIANRVGCVWATANRRLIQLAKEGEVEVLDPENDKRGIPDNETTTRPLICYRLAGDGDTERSQSSTDP